MSLNRLKKISWTPILLGIVAMGVMTSCQTPKSSSAPKKADIKDADVAAPKAKETKAPEEKHEPLDVSAILTPLVYSLQSGAMNSHPINREKAAQLAESLNGKLSQPTQKDYQALVGLLGLQSVAGLPVDEVFSAARRLVELEMSKSIEKDLPEVGWLHIALASLNVRNFAMAEHFMYKIIRDSKNKKLKAAAYTIEGVIALFDDRLPEAMSSWQDALKEDPGCKAALLNVGFLALRYGDHKTAQSVLSKVDDDWYAQYGLLVVARLDNRPKDVTSLCSRILSRKNKYRPAAFSCALNAYQGEKDYGRAITMINELLKDGRGPAQLDERAYKVLEQIQRDKEADEMKKREGAAGKAKKPGAAGAAGKGAAP